MERHGCEFSQFFACAEGTTPDDLLKRGIYAQIAVALKGGEWRRASMVMLAEALAAFEADPEALRRQRSAAGNEADGAARLQHRLQSIASGSRAGAHALSSSRQRLASRFGVKRTPPSSASSRAVPTTVEAPTRAARGKLPPMAGDDLECAASTVVGTGGAATHEAPPTLDGIEPDDGDDAWSDGDQSVQSHQSFHSRSSRGSAAAHAIAGTLGSSSGRARAGRLACRRPAGSPRPPGTAPKLPDLGDDLLLMAAELAGPRPPRSSPGPRQAPTPTGSSGRGAAALAAGGRRSAPGVGDQQVEFVL